MSVDHIIDIIQPLPGIERDGTQFDSKGCIDGQWCRWYRGQPKKMGGYRLLDPGTTELIRNLYVVNKQNSVDIYLGRPSSLEFSNTTLSGISGAENTRTPVGFLSDPDNMWTFDQYTDISETTTTLANNPVTVAMGSNVATLTVASSSIFFGNQVVTIAGATMTGSITVDQLNITAEITIVDATHISYVFTGTAAAADATGGGNAVTITYNSSVTYLMAHAAPNAADINNNVQTNIYWGNINTNAALALIDPINLPVSSGGFVVASPYVFIYGDKGVVSYTLTPDDWSAAVNTAIDSSKIIKGILTRGGSTLSVLFFSMDKVIRATFQGGAPAWAFTTIQEKTSIMSQNCVVSVFDVVYWLGIDQFYTYTGVIRPLRNDMSTDYFFNNINFEYRNKVYGWVNQRYREIWWHWPKGDATECTDVLIYNYESDRWYDSVLGRTAAVEPNFFTSPIMADSNKILNKFTPITTLTVALPTDALGTTNGSSTIVVTLGEETNLQSGNIVTISGAAAFGGLLVGDINVTSPIIVTSFPNTNTVFTYTAGDTATITDASGGGAAMFYSQQVPNECYGVWQHEIGTDMVLYGQSLAIQSYYETNIKTLFEANPTEDRNLRIRRIEPDFVQNGNMTLTIKYRSFAQSTINSSTPYTFLPGQEVVTLAKVDTVQMGRLVSFRFESNVVGGDYQAGKVLSNYAPGDVRP